MKKILLLTFFLALFIDNIYGQRIRLTDTAYAAKGIVVESDTVSTNDVIDALYRNGYVIETVTDYVISTKFNALRGSWKYDIHINKIANKFIFRIYLHVGNLVGHEPCINRGHKKSAWITGFNSLLQVIESLDVPFKYIASEETSETKDNESEDNNYDNW